MTAWIGSCSTRSSRSGISPGGLRTWWRRLHDDSDAELDNTHLMRMAGRFARRVKAWGAANGVPVIFCKAGERKHRIAEAYLATHEVGIGVFLVLVAKAPAPVWKVARSSKTGAIVNIERRREYVNHYSFHIIDPEWGHVTIKMSGHPPFGAQIILNGHEYVARQAAAAGIAFTKVGNCFTAVADPAGLARIADALSQDAAVGRLGQVCQRWIYTACLCFGLDLDEQHRSGFGYGFAVYQLEYSRNLIFADGATMQRVFDTVVDRTRSRLDVPKIRTIFGTAQRPRRTRKRSSTIEAAIETPTYDLTVFKLHFGRLTGKAYTKDEMCWGTPSAQTLVDMASVMFQELEEVPMTMVGGLDVHRQQITFDYVDDDGLVHWGQIRPATRKTLRGWLAEHSRMGTRSSRWRAAPGGAMSARSWRPPDWVCIWGIRPRPRRCGVARSGPRPIAPMPGCCARCWWRAGSRSRGSRRRTWWRCAPWAGCTAP